MSEPMDLEAVIEDSLNDATVTDDVTTTDTTVDTPVDTSVDEPVAPIAVQPESDQVTAPTKGDGNADDDFDKRFGLQSQSITGRENRIPYSRVRKIIEKNERDTIARITKELESKFNPQVSKLTEIEPKIKDYEERLQRVAEFENILENDPRQFLTMLSKVPAYKEFFDFVGRAIDTQAGGTASTPAQSSDPMPQPDQTLADGSKVYSMEGLNSLLEWQARQVEQKTIAKVEQRYKPIEQAWQSQEHLNRIAPVVERQIAEARTWPHFNEHEKEVVAALRANKHLSLEGAYRQVMTTVVLPKLQEMAQPNRDKLRAELLEEIRKAPVAPTAPVAPVKPNYAPVQTSGQRDLNDVIADSLKEKGLL